MPRNRKKLTFGYRANDDRYPSNVQKAGTNKPGYLPTWGFNDGAQIITGGGDSLAPTTPVTPSNPPKASPTPKKEETQLVDNPTMDCDWPDHCLGARCNTYNDCAGDLICTGGKCSVKSNLKRRTIRKRDGNGGL